MTHSGPILRAPSSTAELRFLPSLRVAGLFRLLTRRLEVAEQGCFPNARAASNTESDKAREASAQKMIVCRRFPLFARARDLAVYAFSGHLVQLALVKLFATHVAQLSHASQVRLKFSRRPILTL